MSTSFTIPAPMGGFPARGASAEPTPKNDGKIVCLSAPGLAIEIDYDAIDADLLADMLRHIKGILGKIEEYAQRREAKQ